MNLFLVPASGANIGKSISGRVALPEGSLSPSQLSKIKHAYGGNKAIHCFAMTENSRKTFKQTHADDIARFSLNGTGKFNYKGTIALSIECRESSVMLWGNPLRMPLGRWSISWALRKWLCSRCVWVSSDGGDQAVFWRDVNAWFF